MKLIRSILLFLFVLGVHHVTAQNLTQVRCYFDGVEAQAQFFSVANITDLEDSFVLNVSALSKGVHKLYVEVKDNNGRWSLYASKNVHIVGGVSMATLNEFEYFYDVDPGLGEGIIVAVDGTNVVGDFDLSVEGLDNGVHLLYVRTKDASGQWSLSATEVIHVVGAVNENIVEAEYFFDEDPGFGQGIGIPLDNFSIDQNFEIDLAGLFKGVHKLYVRVKDARGQWSLTAEHNIEVQGGSGYHDLLGAEYFFDVDPGFGNAYPIDIPEGTSFDESFDVEVPMNLSNGPHTMYVRVLDGSGQWSLYAYQTMNVCDITIPQVNVTGNSCLGGSQNLTVGGNYLSYEWSTNQTSSSINVSQSGTYAVTVTDADCETTVFVEVEFSDVGDPTIEIEGNNCPGDIQTLTVLETYDSYEWSNGSLVASTFVNQQGTYSVIVSENGCSTEVDVFVDYIDVATPQIIVTGENCIGEVLQLDAGSGYDIYDWSTGAFTQTINVTQSGTYTVEATIGECTVSDEVDIEFVNMDAPEITLTGVPCEGQIQTLDAGPGYDSYLWNTNAQTSFINVTVGGSYWVEVTEGNCSAISIIDVEFEDFPELNITVTGGNCEGDIQTLDAGPFYDSYLWSTNAQTSFINVTTEGEYEVTVTTGVCTASLSDEITFIVLPEPTITATSTALTCDQGGYNYQWFLNGELIPGATNQSYIPTVDGDYSVEISEDDCTAQSDEVDFVVDSILSIDSSGWNVFPNPADQYIFISHSQQTNEQVLIYDSTGREVNSGLTGTPISTAHLAPGWYAICIKAETGIWSSRFAIVH